MSARRKTPAQQEERLARGRVREGARFTAAPGAAGLPEAYPVLLTEIKEQLRQARLKTVLAANASLVKAYWQIGRTILTREAEGWGARVIDRLSTDLREAFPGMQGLSPRNLKYMRAFATAWPDPEIVQATLAQITWYQNATLLEEVRAPELRLWYARQAAHHGWSQPILSLQIESRLHERHGQAQHNFPATLPPADSER